MIQTNEGISRKELAVRISMSEKTVQRAISSLLMKGVIERVGSNKTGYWKVKGN